MFLLKQKAMALSGTCSYLFTRVCGSLEHQTGDVQPGLGCNQEELGRARQDMLQRSHAHGAHAGSPALQLQRALPAAACLAALHSARSAAAPAPSAQLQG